MKNICHPMWLGLDSKGHVQAVWWRGCVQPFAKWRKAVKALGYKPVSADIWY